VREAIVVGGGICGLAAAYELARRDVRVVVLERTAVGAEQSAGLARIFRIAHTDPRLCALALEAHAGWGRWAEQLGTARLLGDEGLVSAGPAARTAQAPAMAAAGASWEPVAATELPRRVPAAAADHPWGDGLLDPLAGAIRVRRTLAALAARLTVRTAAAVAVEDHGGAAVVRLAGGELLRADRVLLCAGTEVPVLAATAGLAVPTTFTHHVRLSYRRRVPEPPGACLTVGEAYALPLGRTGTFGLGLDDPAGPAPYRTTEAGDFAAAVRAQHAAWVPRHLPGLDPDPIGEVRCVAVQAPWLDAHGDGFAALRRGAVIAFTGSNLMKFAPVLGDRLARTVLAEDGVHEDLAPEQLVD
jgi:glycine/D-amino acid oxidase-like deaminating enzyme